MQPSQYLRPLLQPTSVALIGASSRPGSMGCIVMDNLLHGSFQGELYPVNPRHREVLGKPSYASLADIGKPIDLALVAVPAASVMTVLDDCRRVGVRAAVVLS